MNIFEEIARAIERTEVQKAADDAGLALDQWLEKNVIGPDEQ